MVAWYIDVLIVLVIALIFIGAIKRRWKKKHGYNLTLKELFKRWGKGIDGITPIQVAFSQLLGTITFMAGVIFGLVTSFFIVFLPKINSGAVGFLTTRPVWFFVTMLGSFILATLGLLASIQKYRRTKMINDKMKEIEMLNNTEVKEEIKNEY